jgi:hypothetical protein
MREHSWRELNDRELELASGGMVRFEKLEVKDTRRKPSIWDVLTPPSGPPTGNFDQIQDNDRGIKTAV